MPALIIFAFLACNNPNPPPTAQDTTIRTVDKVKAEKPKFNGYFPAPYILGQDTSYIRIVTNSPFMQKAWMVYYDAMDQKWSTITWTGRGINNTIIGDTVFTQKNGLINSSSTDDAPIFYTAVSQDSGKTWQPYHTYKTFYLCQQTGVRRSFYTALLVSNDYLNENKRPSITILIQNPKQHAFTQGEIEGKFNFDFLCPVTRQILLRP